MKHKIITLILLALAALTASAQDDFNPTLPGEPNALYKVTVRISPTAAGTVSGGGSFAEGCKVTIRRNEVSITSSSTVYYRFKYWTLNGEEYTPAGQSTSFTYTVGTTNAAFEAVYEKMSIDEVTSKVFLVSDPSDACTFNASSGQRYLEGNDVYLYYNATSSAFVFQGWYDEAGELVSSNRYFYYTVPKDNTTLTARFTYEPQMPGEPENDGQTDIDNSPMILGYKDAQIIMGDMDRNGQLSVGDVTLLTSTALEQTPVQLITIDDFVRNDLIAGIWYLADSDPVTFLPDGTTDYDGGTAKYKFIPALRCIILTDDEGQVTGVLNVTLLNEERLCIDGEKTYSRSEGE